MIVFIIYHRKHILEGWRMNRLIEANKCGTEQSTALFAANSGAFESFHPFQSTLRSASFGYSGHRATVRWTCKKGPAGGREGLKIYCRQLWSNFGRPLNVSYQYAIVFALRSVCARRIILLFFYSSPCAANWIWKLTFFSVCCCNFFEIIVGKTDFKFIIGIRGIIYELLGFWGKLKKVSRIKIWKLCEY